ncbi:MAG: phosphate ABC transporter permease subunit PstC [Chloroflexota bacterium]
MRQGKGIQYLFLIFAAIVVVLTALIFLFLATGLGLFFSDGYSPLAFFTGTSWNPHSGLYGILPLLVGSFAVAALTLLISAPLALLVSLYIVEVAPDAIQRPMRTVIDLMAALPSVIYGLLALTIVVPWVRVTFNAPLGKGILPAVIVLIFMVQPTMVAVAEDALRNVPRETKEGSYGLGATRWQTITGVMIPSARRGLISAVILGLGRAVGETMAVQMVIGNVATQIPKNLVTGAATMPSQIVTEWAEATSQIHKDALIMVGFVLLVITMGLIIVARRTGARTA